ncbi:Wzz/FepE/Etk N-terminal domain-containing protein [Pseudomonas sp. rhizo25]|uniref:Wzz/FepE/Etk N-terminal domain-containing protein n=1 Tax=Pseudomonas sp. rhizo25 TaxID=3059675 RepID=UPI00288DF7FA|nr:Wzz/FepE/Etk N-terminal domain-containing protein [Pseudomonas sp. rhizo25]MDT3232526.1 Wzz/FepE/Etk N-terminal domain-containing protein [Pseudomonas sp. rhizo25]
MSSSFRAPPVPTATEINFLTLFDAVKRQKKFIFVVASTVALAATAYAFMVTPEYQVSSLLRPAAINELDALNRSEIYQLPPSQALVKVGSSLESYEVRLSYFRNNQKLFQTFVRPGRTLEQSFEEFNRNSMRISLPDPKKGDPLSSYILVDMNYPKGVDGVSILNGFVNYAIASEKEKVAADLKVIVSNRLNELSEKMNAARANYENDKAARIAKLQEGSDLSRARLEDERRALHAQLKTVRADRISQLNEAIGIARSLGIRKPATPSSMSDADRAGSSSIMRTEVNNQQTPLYFMGVDALEAEKTALQRRTSDDFTSARIGEIDKELKLLEKNREIEVLKDRKNEDLFLAGVEPLRAESARLRNLNIDMNRLKLVAIDRQALEPLSPINPKKKLLIIFGVFLGLALAICLALFRSLYSVHNVGSKNSQMTRLSQ